MSGFLSKNPERPKGYFCEPPNGSATGFGGRGPGGRPRGGIGATSTAALAGGATTTAALGARATLEPEAAGTTLGASGSRGGAAADARTGEDARAESAAAGGGEVAA